MLSCAGSAFGWSHPSHEKDAHSPYHVGRKVSRPRVFGDGIISTVDDEIGGAFSPDGTEFYCSRFLNPVEYNLLDVTIWSRYNMVTL